MNRWSFLTIGLEIQFDKFQSAGFFQYPPKERTSIRVFLCMCVPFSCIFNKDGSFHRFATILYIKYGVTAFVTPFYCLISIALYMRLFLIFKEGHRYSTRSAMRTNSTANNRIIYFTQLAFPQSFTILNILFYHGVIISSIA